MSMSASLTKVPSNGTDLHRMCLSTSTLRTTVLYCISATSRRTMIITTIIHPMDERDGRKKVKTGLYLSQIKSGKGRGDNEKREVHITNDGAEGSGRVNLN